MEYASKLANSVLQPVVTTHRSFKEEYSIDDRTKEANRIRSKYPDRIPVIVELAAGSHDMPCIDKKKYLVPADLSMGQFIFVIRKRIKLPPEKGLFLFVNGTIPQTSVLMATLYDVNRDKDGFLYVTYNGENTFGNF